MIASTLIKMRAIVRRIGTAIRRQDDSGRAAQDKRSFVLTNGQMILPGIVTTYEWTTERT